MIPGDQNLFVEINDFNFIFAAIILDENQKSKISKKIISSHKGIYSNKIFDIEKVSDLIKKNVREIENELDCVFKDVTLVLDNFNFSFVNVSGFKKLNESQIFKDNISYILNSIKSVVTSNEKEKSLLHIFNSKSVLDGNIVENLPIGLFGDFYIHELAFFLIKKNDLNNLNLIFNKNNLKIKKVLMKSFISGSEIINQNKDSETFFLIKIKKEFTQVDYFDRSAYKFFECFNFGTNIVIKDISKVCSLDNDIINKILSSDTLKSNTFNDNETLDEKFFQAKNFRKIKKQLIKDIAKARIEEIHDIIFNHNINLNNLKLKKIKLYLIIEDKLVLDNFKEEIHALFKDASLEVNLINDFDSDITMLRSFNLSLFGWKKEAVPIVQKKSSIISRIFKSLFD